MPSDSLDAAGGSLPGPQPDMPSGPDFGGSSPSYSTPDGERLRALVERMQNGDREAFAQAFCELYVSLKSASRQLVQPGTEQTLSGTALVHEVYMRLERYAPERVTDPGHFQCLASRAMRHVLVDYQRRKQRDKRSATGVRLALDDIAEEMARRARDPEHLDEALTRLEAVDPRAARVVELRFFGGMTHAQVAESLGLTLKQVRTDWEAARAWLANELRERER
jgi:RNA polymerase sigma factor (TIGR02999 family)